MANAASLQVTIDDHYKQCVKALQKIAQLADTGSQVHKDRFCVYDNIHERFIQGGDVDGISNGWRVAEAMREIANDVVGNYPIESNDYDPTR